MATSKQYATVTIPANYLCERSSDRSIRRWPVPMTVRASRSVVINKQKRTFRADSSRWYFIVGPYGYSFEPWEGFAPEQVRFGLYGGPALQEA